MCLHKPWTSKGKNQKELYYVLFGDNVKIWKQGSLKKQSLHDLGVISKYKSNKNRLLDQNQKPKMNNPIPNRNFLTIPVPLTSPI